MLEKPDLPDEKIIACLWNEYGRRVAHISFLALGADRDTAVYRGVADDETPYFIKLRRGNFDETSVALPKFLCDQGVAQIIAPLTTKTGQLRAELDDDKLILYPFVEGHNGYAVNLTERHWTEFGAALERIHTTQLPVMLSQHIRQETFSPQWRERVKNFLPRAENDRSDDPLAKQLTAFLKTKRAEILDLVGRAERLAQALQTQSPEFVLCHSDLHAGNVLLAADDGFYIVDWDNPIYATDTAALDREQEFEYLRSNFLPNNVLEIAYMSDRMRSGTI